jgi:hypothetical protein
MRKKKKKRACSINNKSERVQVHQNPVGKSYRNALPTPNA